MKRIYASLSDQKSIEKAIKELTEYRDSLAVKNEQFVKRLAELGVVAAQERLATGQGDSDRGAKFSISITTTDGIINGTLSITSTPHVDNQGRVFYPHLAWEFGAGIHFNNGNANPHASKLGMGVGKFPEQKFALNDSWWYRDEEGNLHLSQGTQATMPMYNASKTIIQQIETIAREVFSGS